MNDKTRFAQAALLLATLMALGACSSDPPAPKAPVPVVQKVMQAPGRPILIVDEGAVGADIRLEPNQELQVSLRVSSAAIQANEDWTIDDLKPAGVLQVLGPRFQRTLGPYNETEAAGAIVWRLRATQAGRATVKFVLRRAHSLAPPTSSASFDVTVK